MSRFVDCNIVSTLSRLKEVGIRKVLGANKAACFYLDQGADVAHYIGICNRYTRISSVNEWLVGDVCFPYFATLVDICSRFCAVDADCVPYCFSTSVAHYLLETDEYFKI